MSDRNPQSFDPYKRFLCNFREIEEFEKLSDISFGITLQLLFRVPKEEVGKFEFPAPENRNMSYCAADQEVKSVKLSCEWITIAEYANRTERDLSAVEHEASLGELGPVQRCPKTSEKVVIWPPEKRGLPREELPEPGKKAFTVNVSVAASAPLSFDVDDEARFERVQNAFLRLAHSMGEPEEVTDRTKKILYRSCLLLRWTAFEVYLRDSIHALFHMHPEVLAAGSRARKASLSYEDVVALSQKFTSVDLLKQALVEREIKHGEADGRSVHGLINLLKTSFRFETDPYETWYVIHGKRHETSFTSLLEVKSVRNALIHDGGKVDSEFVRQYPGAPCHDGVIAIDNDYNLKSRLVMRSIAHKIADTIAAGRYKVGELDGKKT